MTSFSFPLWILWKSCHCQHRLFNDKSVIHSGSSMTGFHWSWQLTEILVIHSGSSITGFHWPQQWIEILVIGFSIHWKPCQSTMGLLKIFFNQPLGPMKTLLWLWPLFWGCGKASPFDRFFDLVYWGSLRPQYIPGDADCTNAPQTTWLT